MEYDAKYYLQSLAKGLSVLDTFKSDQDEYGITAISEMTNIPESTVQRIVNTLEFKGFLLQNPANKKYRLSIRMLCYNRATRTMQEWLKRTKVHMNDLNLRSGETVNLAVRYENTLIYLDKVDSSHMLRPNFTIGNRYPLYCTGLGRCLISDLPEDLLEVLFKGELKKLTPYTKTELPDLKKDLAMIREEGYFFDDEEFNLGVTCVAAPICAFDKKVVAAISVSLPKVRLTEKNYQDLVSWTKAAAEKISREYRDLFET